ncbi:MAG: lysophospholipid acyltransferase family protein [Clostridia bacterium]|nr:lysophospholipid acyltransferase family protein [Clostridia bacterium]
MAEFKYEFDYKKEIPERNKYYDMVGLRLWNLLKNLKYKDIKVKGRENIPKSGGYLITCNHFSGWDPIVLASAFHPTQLHFIAKAEFFDTFYTRIPLLIFNGFPIDRTSLDFGAINYSKRLIKNGHPVLIFAQGTRQKNNNPPENFKSGAAIIIKTAKADVLPVSIKYRNEGSKRPTPYVSIGKLIPFEDFQMQKASKSKMMHNVVDRIEKEVVDLWKNS